MSTSSILSGLVTLALAGMGSAQTVTLDFGGAPFFVSPLPWSEEGFTFTELDAATGVLAIGGTEELWIFSDASGAARARLTQDGGGTFDALSVDIGSASTVLGSGHFTLESNLGFRRITQADEFTTVALSGPAWTGIAYLDIVYAGGGGSQDDELLADNFVVRPTPPVPALSALQLLALTGALLGLGAGSLRRRRAPLAT